MGDWLKRQISFLVKYRQHTKKQSLHDNVYIFTEELQRLLKNEMGVRKQVEGDINKIKKGLEAQVNKEKSQRDEISKQLQVMKGKVL